MCLYSLAQTTAMLKKPMQILMLTMLWFGYLSTAETGPQIELSSGEMQVPLVELFTSEGCSSCPPADRWLSRLVTDPDLWTKFTPIAFHVDYWDYIGWQDEFAQAKFGDRQRRYAVEGGARFVYTPGFFLKGAEWHGWRTLDSIPREKGEVGVLSLHISGEQVVARFNARDERHGELTLHVAVLGMNIETHVKAGENNGKSLHHDFVALGVESIRLAKAGMIYRGAMQLPDVRPEIAERAIVAWVADAEQQSPIQSVGGLFGAAKR